MSTNTEPVATCKHNWGMSPFVVCTLPALYHRVCANCGDVEAKSAEEREWRRCFESPYYRRGA
jgi:hypothetical protein